MKCQHQFVKAKIRFRKGQPCKTASMYCEACGARVPGIKAFVETTFERFGGGPVAYIRKVVPAPVREIIIKA